MDKFDEISAEMTNLLKRTRKSCLRFFRKISPPKQLFMKKLEEDEISATNVDCLPSFEAPRNAHKLTSVSGSGSTESLKSTGFTTNHTVQNSENPKHANDDEVVNIHDNPSDAILHSLTSKLFLTADGYEFQRLQQLRSDTASEIFHYESEPECANVVFEKVKYKEHVRYLRHTPSSMSLDNCATSSMAIMADGQQSSYSDHFKRNDISNFTTSGLHMYKQQQQQPSAPLPINVSLGLQSDGSYHSVTISEERDLFNKLTPVVKWDINGNSLDEPIFLNDNWDKFEARMGDKTFAQLKAEDSQKSSFRSSSTTLETWVEEELIENSFNEKLKMKYNLCLTKA